MTRLNIQSRQQIVRELIDHRFGKEAKAIQEARAEITDRLYQRWRKDQRIDPLTLPRGWLPDSPIIYASISGVVCGHRFDGRDPKEYYSDSDTKPVPYTIKGRTVPMLIVDATDPLAIDHAALEVQASRHKEERTRAEAATHSAVQKFYTVENLLKEWPEIESIITIPDKRPATLLPVLRTEELNALLGLTKEKTDDHV